MDALTHVCDAFRVHGSAPSPLARHRPQALLHLSENSTQKGDAAAAGTPSAAKKPKLGEAEAAAVAAASAADEGAARVTRRSTKDV
jgi:hypothetical protein